MVRSTIVALVSSVAVACGGPQGDGLEHPTPEEHEPGPADSVEATQPPAPAVTNPELARALDLLCQRVTEAMADRSVRLEVRAERVEEGFEGTEHDEVLDDFFDRVEDRRQGLVFEAVAAQAEADGVPGYQCEPFARMLVLMAAGDQDVDPSLVATVEQDLERMCRIATEVAAEAGTPEERASRMGSRWDQELSNPTVRDAFDGVAMASPPARYPMLRDFAAESGVSGFTCPAIETLWGLPEP
jgi:hypothetical protein